jgi:phospholipase/carboxylesterase
MAFLRAIMSELETSQKARDSVASFMQKNGLPGKIQDYDDEMLQFNEVVVVVETEPQLQQWIEPTKPFQITLLAGIHEHGAAPGIADHIRYVVIRANGAEGVIGGAPPGVDSPAANGWTLWIRHYPNGRTIFKLPPADRDLVPGRANNILLPLRKGVRPVTGSTLPHQQLTQHSPADIRAGLRDWMERAFPETRTGPSEVSDHTTWALHLTSGLAASARILAPVPGVTEFAHLHVDGSWHLALPAEDRWELMIKGWGAVHPVARFGINAIMFYSPRTPDEVKLLKQAVTASYRYARGEIK